MGVSLVLYLPTLFAIWFFDRREREPLSLVLLVALSVIVLFAPMAAQVNNALAGRIPVFLFVGFNEEFWKAVPVLLLALFLPRAVNGTRDGLIFGTISGLAFAVIEFGLYVSYESFDEVGWTALLNQVARANILGTHNHILWSAALGSAIGWAAASAAGWRRIAVPLLAYLGVAITHGLEDGIGNVGTTMLAGMVLEPLLMMARNPEATTNAWMIPIQVYFGTVNILVVNVIVLPVVYVVLRRSGDTERRIIREQLATESDDIVTPGERPGIEKDQRFRSRQIPGWHGPSARRLVQLQNAIAFQKAFASRQSISGDVDPCVLELRRSVRELRAPETDRSSVRGPRH